MTQRPRHTGLPPAALLASLALALAGCPPATNPWITGNVSGPLLANNELVWLNRTIAVAAIVDPSGAETPFGVDVTTLPRAISPTPNGFVVTGGRGDAPVLDVFTLPAASRRSLSVSGAYDDALISPDGHYAVLYYNPTVTPAPGGPAARDNNQICIVNLQALTTTTLSLQTESIAPTNVIFSPNDQVAAVLMDGTIVFLLPDQPAVQVQVPLTLSDGTTLQPRKALFSPDGAFLYVLANGSSDVLALNVVTGSGTITTAVNFLFQPEASGLVDIDVPGGSEFNQYVAALYSSSSSRSTTGEAVLLDATGDTSLTQFLPVTGDISNFVDLGGGRLLIVDSTGVSVTGWEPLENRSDQATLAAAPNGLPLIAQGHAVFVNPAIVIDGDATAALTSVSADDNGAQLLLHQAPIVLGASPVPGVADYLTGDVFFGLPVARAGSGAGPQAPRGKNSSSGTTGSIVSLNPATLAIGGLVLDNNIEAVGVAGSYGYAIHPDPLGDVSFFSTSSPSRANLRRVYEFLADLAVRKP